MTKAHLAKKSKTAAMVAALSAAACAAVSPMSTAAAQEQTRESAVKFLDLFASQQQPAVGPSTSFDKIDATQRLTMMTMPVPTTKWVKTTVSDPNRPCRVEIATSDGRADPIYWDKVEIYFWTRASWSDAILASDYGPRLKPLIEVRAPKYGTSFVFWPATEDQGSRLVKAMQFLKNSCDPMKATGF